MSRWLPEIRRRLASANLDPSREADIALELEQHLEDRYREMRAEGLDEEQARAAALAEIAEDVRMRRELTTIEPQERPPVPLGEPTRRSRIRDFAQDVRYAVRLLRRHPAFAALSISTLALGIGATTIVYAIVDNVVLRQLPYAHAERLVRLQEIDARRPDARYSASYPNLMDWQAQSRSFEAMGIQQSLSLTLLEGEPERVTAGAETPGYFKAAGVQPMLGRPFIESDLTPGAPKVVLVGHGAWQRRFGSDPAIVGRSIQTVDGAYQVIGVLPAVSFFGSGRDFWIPFTTTPAMKMRDARLFWVLARLRDGVTIDEARAEMNTVAAALATAQPVNKGWGINVTPMHDWRMLGVKQPLYTFLGAVLCILLLACVNVAGLLVARGADRSGEIAVRISLGAARDRIVRQLVTESVVLALIGGALGTLIAWWGTAAIVPLFPVTLPAEWITVDLRVVGIAIGASALTGLLFGTVPALGISRGVAAGTRKHISTSAWSGRLGRSLIAVELALALVLLTGAGLMVRSLVTLYAVEPGMDVNGVVALRATPLLPRDAAPHRAQAFYGQLLDRVAGLPGVDASAAIDTPPFGGSTSISSAVSDVEPTPVAVSPRSSTPGYFATMGMTIRAGRDFTGGDAATAARVVVVNEVAARKLWPGQNPLGRELRYSIRGSLGEPFQVVGVTSDVRHDGLDNEPLAEVYHPLAQRPVNAMTLVVRTSDASAVARQVRGLMTTLPERALVGTVSSFSTMVGSWNAERRNRAVLLGILAGLGVLLAAVGVFSLTAYSVTQRTKEIGVRMALGADGRQVLRVIVGSLIPPLGLGVLFGLAGSWWATQWLRSFLFGVEPTDPLTFTAVAALISAVGLLACYLPARRALRVDPVNALRAE